MRRILRLLPLAAFALVGGPRSTVLSPIYAERIIVTATPVRLSTSSPRQVRVGALTLVAGWRLESVSPQFGGWSGLHVAGDRVTMLGDAGSIVRFRLTRFGRAVDARIDPLPAGCGGTTDKRARDSESFARTPGGWLVGYEARHRLCATTADFARATAMRTPPEMANWRRASGVESMVRLRDGRTLVLAERAPAGTRERPLLIFTGDPVDATVVPKTLQYRPPQGYAPTDAAELPDGRILIVNRRFGWDLFTSVLVVVDLAAINNNAVIEGHPIARFTPPLLSDNFEGVSVSTEGDKMIVWLASDDNSMSWQRSYLLKFVLDPNAGSAIRPRPAPSASP